MKEVYLPDEQEVLTREYRLAPEPLAEQPYSLAAADLLDPDFAVAYLERVNAIYEASSRMATASLFTKRYNCLTMASSLYAMSVFNKGMNCEIHNCHMESYHQGHAWLPKLRLYDWTATQPAEGDRERWRDSVIRGIFADNLTLVYNVFAKAAPVSKAVLWENTAIYIFWLYESKFEEGLDEQTIAQVRDDFDYILHRAPGELFGEKRNPLTPFSRPKVVTSASDKPLRLRKTCCYYYMASDDPEDYCPTCPKIKHEILVPS